MSDTLSFSGDIPTVAEAIEIAKRRWPEQVHLRVAENTTLCQRAAEATQADVWGQFLTDVRAEVGCPKCLEWMHA